MYRIEITGGIMADASQDEVIAQARHIRENLRHSGGDKISVKVFDYSTHKNVSIEKRPEVKTYTGRQESEGVVQAVVRSMKTKGLVSEGIDEKISSITSDSLKLDETVRHYSVDYGKLHDLSEEFANDKNSFAVEFKSVITDILLNNAAGGTAFMKKAKKG